MITGERPQLLSVRYLWRNKELDRKECFQVIWKDDNGIKHCTEEPPDVDFWIVKPEYRTYTITKPQEKMENMNKVTCPYSKIKSIIANEAGEWGQMIINGALQLHDRTYSDELYRWPYAYGADFQPEYYFLKRWYDKYPLTLPNLSKAYLDIEVDQIDGTIDPQNPEKTAHAPVNLITVQLDESNECFTFVLRPRAPIRRNQTDKEWEKRVALYRKQLKDHEYLMAHKSDFYRRCKKEFEPVYGETRYQLREYDEEIKLITDVFQLFDARRPDFCLIWNMRFDIPYLIGRVQTLGYDPESIMCSKNIKYPMCRFVRDTSTWQQKKQIDVFILTSFTMFVCQERLYGGIRKSQHELRSMKLNSIMDQVLKDHKVDYPSETNFIEFPYRDWILFILYNIKDTQGQKGIERVINDVRTWYMRAHKNLTPYNRVFRESYLLRNVREKFFEMQGLVQSNNVNLLNIRKEARDKRNRFEFDDDFMNDEEEIGTSYKGAIVADPTLNARVGRMIMGKQSNTIFSYVIDFDMSSFYPSITIACNIDGSTMIFKAKFINSEFMDGVYMNRSLNQVYFEKDKFGKVKEVDMTGEAINSFCSKNSLTFVYCWLGGLTTQQMEEELMRRFASKLCRK